LHILVHASVWKVCSKAAHTNDGELLVATIGQRRSLLLCPRTRDNHIPWLVLFGVKAEAWLNVWGTATYVSACWALLLCYCHYYDLGHFSGDWLV